MKRRRILAPIGATLLGVALTAGAAPPSDRLATRTQQLPAGINQLRLPTPESHNVFAYPYQGDIRVGGEDGTMVRRGDIALLGPGTSIYVASDQAASFILVGGKPLDEPIARYGPFVMNTADEIRQAIMDYQAGRF